jgi:hypothetical protein
VNIETTRHLVGAWWVAAVVVAANQLQVLHRLDLVLVVPGDAGEACVQNVTRHTGLLLVLPTANRTVNISTYEKPNSFASWRQGDCFLIISIKCTECDKLGDFRAQKFTAIGIGHRKIRNEWVNVKLKNGRILCMLKRSI